MNAPLVSVVMVVCNVERFLGEAIESILGQTFTDFEFIIVDFGSTDKSKAIVLEFAARDSRIKFHEIAGCGLAEARNAGCKLALAQYVAIMDADDISLPNRLKWEVEFMEKHSGVGLLGGAKEWVDASGKSLFINGDPTEDNEIRLALEVRCAMCQPTVLFRREAFILAGGYREAFAPAEDYDLWLRIIEHFQCANLAQVVLKYRIHPYQVSFRKLKQQALSVLTARASVASRKIHSLDALEGVREITPALLTELGISKSRQATALASHSRDWIQNMCLAGEFSSALNAAVEVLHSSDLEGAEKRIVADLWLAAAGLYWKQKGFLNSIRAFAHAILLRPVVLGRPLKQRFQRH